MIFGDRIRLRAVERSDLPSFLKWFNDPEVIQGLGINLPLSSADEDDWFEAMRKRPPEQHNLCIEVRLTGQGFEPQVGSENPRGLGETTGSRSGEPGSPEDLDWKMIGGCGFFNFDNRNRSAEFGISIGDKAYWDQGYGTEAVRLLMRHGFKTLNLNRIYLRVFETNQRAIRAYEKAGFTHEIRQRQAEYKDGRYIDVLEMSILREEFTG